MYHSLLIHTFEWNAVLLEWVELECDLWITGEGSVNNLLLDFKSLFDVRTLWDEEVDK